MATRRNISDFGCDILVCRPRRCHEIIQMGIVSMISCRIICVDEANIVLENRNNSSFFIFNVIEEWKNRVPDQYHRQLVFSCAQISNVAKHWMAQLNDTIPIFMDFKMHSFRRRMFENFKSRTQVVRIHEGVGKVHFCDNKRMIVLNDFCQFTQQHACCDVFCQDCLKF